jgi:Eco57I restriction-modification methylase
LRDDNEINPDVLGYIFEKFINQKQMGAYYTKEDITEYISENTIIPFLFDRVKEKVSIAFDRYDGVWQLLQDNPDRYIYEAIKKGVIDEDGETIEVPEKIRVGIDDVSQRGNWNETADEDYGLPTEIWREYIARRERCLEIRQKMQNGEIFEINDLITYNLDIRQFAQDVVHNAEDSNTIKAFYQAIAGRIPERSNEKFEQGITILDPTCGSGALLFAALQILEPLLDKCLDRMEEFVEMSDQIGKTNDHKTFRNVLAEIEKHPSRDYFTMKSIIINNLFGVDIMPDAVEICKLRLFLQLVAQADADSSKDNYGLEPLPDIDFNIRAENTLVGFANREAIDKAFGGDKQGRLSFHSRADEFDVKAQDVARQYELFRLMQITEGEEVSIEDKRNLQEKLVELSDELDKYIANEYGINEIENPEKFKSFLKSHQPFHWYSEFYGIIADGGFDVIIGNPPYVEYSKIRKSYKIISYETESSGNLYAFVMERSIKLLRDSGKLGFIVPISLTCTQRMSSIQNILLDSSAFIWNSTYAERPSKLFSGADVLLTITILTKKHNCSCITRATGLRKWRSDERPNLFALTDYQLSPNQLRDYILPKISSEIELSILEKLWSDSQVLGNELLPNSEHKIFYPRLRIRENERVFKYF